MGSAVGLDLGTTFSTAAYVGEDQCAYALPNAEGMRTTPSVALWYNGTFLVGQPALDVISKAEGTERDHLMASLIRGVKRMIHNPPPGGLISNGHPTDPIEVSAAILSKLARDASLALNFPVHDVVIAVPAHFVDQERSATRAAAEKAGLRVLQMINEPSAAALTYTHGSTAQIGTALVFDLGGGTFDATVLHLDGREARVLATKGIEELGGLNFTNELAKMLQRTYKRETGEVYPTDSRSNDQLVVVAETAKCQLSQTFTTRVRLTPSQRRSLDIEITRKQFEEAIDLLVHQLQVAVELALQRADKTPAEIDRVLLCGGSSRIPAVQAMLTDFFGRPPEASLDLDLSVALGAAYLAAAYKTEESRGPGLQLVEDAGLVVDCVTYQVGIALKNAQGESIKLIMLRPGDPLDTWSQPFPVRIIGTAHMLPPIEVYSGDNPQLKHNDLLGTVTLSLPPSTPAGARCMVMMRQDRSGLLQVQITLEGRNFPGNLQRRA